ncbi:endo-1,4-beta-xylanase [Pseudoduganella lutea]|nr:endo-1,4-beta-xylanase [Pseudoduganella lutea]
MFRRLFLALGLLLAGAAASAAAPAPLTPALQAARPLDMLAPDRSAFSFRDAINPEGAKGSVTVAGNADGAPVFRATNPKGSSNYDGIAVSWRTAGPIRRGDVLYARVAMRSLGARQESGESEGLLYFRSEAGGDRQPQTFSIGQEWTTVSFPFVAREDVPAGQGVLAFSYGNLEQTFEIAGLELLNFGDRVKLADLPLTRFTYAGREPDAAWRKAALQRIEQVRTAPIAIKVVDAAGKPVPGAQVKAELVQPEFLWGSEVDAERLVSAGPDGERYRKEVRELFDTTVIGNGLKWPRWRDPKYRPSAEQALDWLRANGKRVKGHNLVWPAWKFTPEDIARDPAQRARIGELVEAHIRDITAATHGKLIGWDVINEPVHEQDYFKHVPVERVAEWFKMAEKSDPALQLTLNEYAMLNRSSSPLFIREFKDFAAMLRKNGARIDILGVQGHVGQTPRAPVSVLSDLDLLAEGGNKVQITEFDMNTPDAALQGDYTRDFLIAVYSHPAVTGFIQWGFWESAHWKPDAAMYRKDWTPKPNLAAWKELVLDRWKTRLDSRTGAAGELAARGHRGRYKATASAGGRTGNAEFTLGAEGAQALITLK